MTGGISAYRGKRATNNEMPCSLDPIISRTVKLLQRHCESELLVPSTEVLTEYVLDYETTPFEPKSYIFFLHGVSARLWTMASTSWECQTIPQPGGSGYLPLSGTSLKTCPVWVALPEVRLELTLRQVIWGANVECWVPGGTQLLYVVKYKALSLQPHTRMRLCLLLDVLLNLRK